MKISIIMPTYNRLETLKKALSSLSSQTFPSEDFEVVIVDDGSTDGTREWLADLEKKENNEWIQVLYGTHGGPSKARNLAIDTAKGKVLLFIGDDIIASPDLLINHWAVHTKYPGDEYAALGFIDWSPDSKVTPFMRWLTTGGPQFAFKDLEGKKEADYGYFYTSNISVKKKLLEDEKFDEDFPYAACEDIELGYRLQRKKGLKIIYEPDAVAYHDHHTSVEDACKRMIKTGESTRILWEKCPDLKAELSPKINVKWLKRRISFLKKSAALFENFIILPIIYKKLMEYHLVLGILGENDI